MRPPGGFLHQLVFLCEDERAYLLGEGHEVVVLEETVPVVAAVGIAPRSTLMKCFFVAYGLAYLGVTQAMVLGTSRAWWGILLMAVLGLWYVPFGALINLVVIVLLFLPSLRASLS